MGHDNDYSFGRIDRQPAVARSKKSRKRTADANPYTTRAELQAALTDCPKPPAGTILVTGCYGLQANLVRNRERHSRYFALSTYGFDAARTHAAAYAWLAALDRELPRMRVRPATNKKDNLPHGVRISRQRMYSRGLGRYRTVSVQSAYYDGAKTRYKTFYVGRETLIEPWLLQAVCELAIQFRAEAEAAQRNGQIIDVAAWEDWRSRLPKAAYEELNRVAGKHQ
ncbi:hypothetical protein C27AD_19493 [Salinisphaera hydrothermalis C27AD]